MPCSISCAIEGLLLSSFDAKDPVCLRARLSLKKKFDDEAMPISCAEDDRRVSSRRREKLRTGAPLGIGIAFLFVCVSHVSAQVSGRRISAWVHNLELRSLHGYAV